MDSPVHL